MDRRHAGADPQRAANHASEPAATGSLEASDGVDEQSEQSFPASDPPSWSGLSLSPAVDSTRQGV
jgi:hypothetical protein